jgi:hypothetical protein
VIKRHERHGFKALSKRWMVERALARLRKDRLHSAHGPAPGLIF